MVYIPALLNDRSAGRNSFSVNSHRANSVWSSWHSLAGAAIDERKRVSGSKSAGPVGGPSGQSISPNKWRRIDGPYLDPLRRAAPGVA